MKILFLDDDYNRHSEFKKNSIGLDILHVHSYDACIKAFETQRYPYDLVYLDHDLSELAAAGQRPQDEKTGEDVVKYIVAMDKSKYPKQVVVHSYNYYGALRMVDLLREAGITVQKIPFGPALWSL